MYSRETGSICSIFNVNICFLKEAGGDKKKIIVKLETGKNTRKDWRVCEIGTAYKNIRKECGKS